MAINLTAKATYTDGKDSNDKDMAEATTIMAVRAAPSSNNAPAFPDQDPSTEDVDKDPQCGRWRRTPLRGGTSELPWRPMTKGTCWPTRWAGRWDTLRHRHRNGAAEDQGEAEPGGYQAADEKTYEVTVTAVDPFGQFDTATVTIEIENEDERPAINERTAKTMLMYEEPDLTAETEPDPVLLWTYMAMDDEDERRSTLLWT